MPNLTDRWTNKWTKILRAYLRTNTDISEDNIRQISVTVIGNKTTLDAPAHIKYQDKGVKGTGRLGTGLHTVAPDSPYSFKKNSVGSDNIRDWAHSVGIINEGTIYVIARSIASKGLKAKQQLDKALDATVRSDAAAAEYSVAKDLVTKGAAIRVTYLAALRKGVAALLKGKRQVIGGDVGKSISAWNTRREDLNEIWTQFAGTGMDLRQIEAAIATQVLNASAAGMIDDAAALLMAQTVIKKGIPGVTNLWAKETGLNLGQVMRMQMAKQIIKSPGYKLIKSIKVI